MITTHFRVETNFNAEILHEINTYVNNMIIYPLRAVYKINTFQRTCV